MDESLQVYWELYYEKCSNELMIQSSTNLLRKFKEQFVDGPMLDLGCGQSNFLVEFSRNGKDIYAVDNEDFQLQFLKKRIESYAGKDAGKLYLLNRMIPQQEIPNEVFSVVIASDFLHFFTLQDCRKIIDQLISRTKSGSLVYVKVHSKSHHYYESQDPGMHDYYKHFFSKEDFSGLFDQKYFERIVLTETVQSIRSAFTKNLEVEWVERLLDTYQVLDPEERNEHLAPIQEEHDNGYLECVYRRR